MKHHPFVGRFLKNNAWLLCVYIYQVLCCLHLGIHISYLPSTRNKKKHWVDGRTTNKKSPWWIAGKAKWSKWSPRIRFDSLLSFWRWLLRFITLGQTPTGPTGWIIGISSSGYQSLCHSGPSKKWYHCFPIAVWQENQWLNVFDLCRKFVISLQSCSNRFSSSQTRHGRNSVVSPRFGSKLRTQLQQFKKPETNSTTLCY